MKQLALPFRRTHSWRQGTQFRVDSANAAAPEAAANLADPPQGGTLWTSNIRIFERRVLAHEQILQVLIAHITEGAPKSLDRLQQIFTNHHTLGANEQDYTDTAGYAEQFIEQVARLRDKMHRS